MHAVVAGNGDRQILQHRRYRKHQSYGVGRSNALPNGVFAVGQIVDDKSRRHLRLAVRNAPQLRIDGHFVAHPLFQHRHARCQIARQNRTARRRQSHLHRKIHIHRLVKRIVRNPAAGAGVRI